MSQPEPQARNNRPRWTGVSVALLLLGLLILPSGLWTAVLGGSIILEGLPQGDLSGIPIVLIYGGVPMAMGAVFVWGAFKARRRDRTMSQNIPPIPSKPRWTGIAIALFVVGLLILVPSGLCTGLGLLFTLSPYGAADPSVGLMVLTFGGVPMALGVALVYAGLKSRRRD